MGNFYNKEEVLLKATGMWQKILPQLCGMQETTFNGKHQPCPCCGGKDRFRFDDNLENKGDGGYVCSQCGSGNGLSLLMKSTGVEFGAAITMLGDWLACVPVEKVAMIKKEIASQKSLPKSAKTFTEDAEALIKYCAEHKKIPTFFTKHSEGKFRCLILNDYESVFPIINATGTIVNAAIVSPYGDIDFVGSEMTSGGFSVIGDNTPKWLICSEIKESIYIHEKTGNRVICAWEDEENPYFMVDLLKGLELINAKKVVRLTKKNYKQLPFIYAKKDYLLTLQNSDKTVNLFDFCAYCFPKLLNSNDFSFEDISRLIVEFSEK